MQEHNQKKIAGLILAIYFRKAFDSIHHSYIQAVLKKLTLAKISVIGLTFFSKIGREEFSYEYTLMIIIVILFVPQEVGEHLVSVKRNGNHIKNMNKMVESIMT